MIDLAIFMLGTAIVQPASADAAELSAIEACETRLASVLAAMEERSPLKDELATWLMWRQLAAESAISSGNVDECQENVATMQQLLGL